MHFLSAAMTKEATAKLRELSESMESLLKASKADEATKQAIRQVGEMAAVAFNYSASASKQDSFGARALASSEARQSSESSSLEGQPVVQQRQSSYASKGGVIPSTAAAIPSVMAPMKPASPFASLAAKSKTT